jgi:hypothetical protein
MLRGRHAERLSGLWRMRPHMARLLSVDLISVAQTIAQEFFEIDGFFQREPDFLLREELAEVKQAASILGYLFGIEPLQYQMEW